MNRQPEKNNTARHISLDERFAIRNGLEKRQSLGKIAKDLSRSTSSISREIRNHRIFVKKGSFNNPFNDCLHASDCHAVGLCGKECANPRKGKRCNFCTVISCSTLCSEYQEYQCPDLLKSPYVCNGCTKRSRCRTGKWMYDPIKADQEKREIWQESHSGISVSEDEIHALDTLISPLVLQGQSIAHICASNADSLNVSMSTLYTYINSGLFRCRNIDLPRRVRFQARRNPVHHKVDKSCTVGRQYEDFLIYLNEQPDVSVVEFDSVEGKKGGKVLLTIYFRKAEMQLAFLRDHNTSQSVIDIVNQLYNTLGKDVFCKLFQVILADNGTEFSNPSAIENVSQDTYSFQRTKVFYCHPSSPGEKGGCERNHTDIRRIIPKGTILDYYTHEDIQLAMHHVNSFRRPALGYKSPYEVFGLMWGQDILQKLGCRMIPDNDIILKPYLLGDRLRARGIKVKASGIPLPDQDSDKASNEDSVSTSAE